jgi:S-formylglutathione hydrolase FrmB
MGLNQVAAHAGPKPIHSQMPHRPEWRTGSLRMRCFVYICLFVAFTASPTRAGLFGSRHKYDVVRLNEKILGSVVDFTNNHGRDRRFWSESLGCKRDMYVYLPPGYDPKNRYPVMLWLHGFIQDEKDFLELAVLFDRSIANGCLPPMIIAAPDGSIRGRPSILASGSFYINSRAGRFEDYIAFDVWNLVATNFSIRPEREAHVIAGGSMGGFGAFNHAIKHRDRYGIVVGLLPPLNARYEDCRGRYYVKFDPNCIGWADRYRPHASVGSFGLIHIPQSVVLGPLFGKDRREAIQMISAENPVEMLYTYDVKPGELSMFIGVGDRDEFNLAAQVDSFEFFARQKGLDPYVIHDRRGRHDTETGVRMFPYFEAWLTPQIKDYAPPSKLGAP